VYLALPSALRTLDCVDVVVLVHLFVLVLLEVEEVDVSRVVYGREDQTRQRTPPHVDDRAVEREVHDRVGFVHVPQLDGEVSRAGNESVRVVVVPVHVLHRQSVASVCFQVGAGLRLGALVDRALLRADQELAVVLLGAEVEAGGCRVPGDGRVLVLRGLVAGHVLVVQLNHVNCTWVLTLHCLLFQFEHHDDLAFQLALNQAPRTQFTIAGHCLEVFSIFFRIPAYLPDWVIVFPTFHGGPILRFAEFVPDVLDQD